MSGSRRELRLTPEQEAKVRDELLGTCSGEELEPILGPEFEGVYLHDLSEQEIANATDGAYAELLTEWQERKRVHGKYEAAHPVRLRQAVMEAEPAGLHLAADAIQSLVFEATVQANNQQHLAEQIAELKRENEDLRTEANGWLKRVELVEGEVREWADAERDYQAECAGGFKPGEAHAVTQRLRRAETSLRQRARLEEEA